MTRHKVALGLPARRDIRLDRRVGWRPETHPVARPGFSRCQSLPFPLIVPNRAYCDGVRRYSMMKARAVRAIASVSLSVAHSLGHEREGYRANAEPQSKLFSSKNRGPDPRVEFCATPPEILAYAAPVFRQMG